MYLVVGEIFEEDEGGLPDGFESTIVLPSLKSLYICVSESATCDVLVAVSAPRLEFLTLDQIQLEDVVQISEHPELRVPDRFSFLHHLGVYLSTRGESFGEQSWTLFLSIFPCITHLVVKRVERQIFEPEELFVALSNGITASPQPRALVLPKLQHLSLTRVTVDNLMLCKLVQLQDCPSAHCYCQGLCCVTRRLLIP
jgi:hypothetical protein